MEREKEGKKMSGNKLEEEQHLYYTGSEDG